MSEVDLMAGQVFSAGNSGSALCLAGLALVAPETSAVRYETRWYKAWEQELHEKLRRTRGAEPWSIKRFSTDSDVESSKFAYRDTLAAVGLAAQQALADAEKRCARRTSRERMGLIYSDFWGRASHLEGALNWRDAFDLDVIPKSLLREHAVDGYSCKLQAGRGSFAQGLQMAADLLYGGDLDVVLVGGVFRFHPALGFSEALENAAAERRWLGRGGRHQALMVERAGFAVLRRSEAAQTLRRDAVQLGTPQYLQLPKGRAAARRALSDAWQAMLPEGMVIGGHRPSSLLFQLERESSGAREYQAVCQQFGDSGGLNPLLALQRLLERQATEPLPALLSLSDAYGGTWMIRCDPLRAKREGA